jgi:hypothetical protein
VFNSFSQQKSFVLQAGNFKHYVDYFNKMETPNIEQAIPNDSAWGWMKKNIPLFECPQQNFEEIFYFRWWTLRKHIKKTEKGFVFTEFLIQRSYSDKYNLISSALVIIFMNHDGCTIKNTWMTISMYGSVEIMANR